MLLNKLESGRLLFQTQQGFVAVEPSFWQRVYLLWTFRNFRQLSLPLLNPRQIALINDLFRQHATVVSQQYEPSFEIGVVQDFVPPAIEIGAALGEKTDASPAVHVELPVQTAGQDVTPLDGTPLDVARSIVAIAVEPNAAEPAMLADAPPAVAKEETENEGSLIDRVEFVPSRALDRSFAPSISWPRAIMSWSILSRLKHGSSNSAVSNDAEYRPAASQGQVSRIVIFRVAAAIGALSLCAFYIVAFHRIGGLPGSQAHSSPPRLDSPDPASAPGPAPVAENPEPVSEGPAQAGDGPDAAAEPAPAKEAPPAIATQRMTTPERATDEETRHYGAGRGGTAGVASRSRGGAHPATLSKVRTSTSTRRVTLTPATREPASRSAQSYFDLANQQMHKGNYAAAAANYKRAWRIEEDRAAARGRTVRARRTMQAENESLANRR